MNRPEFASLIREKYMLNENLDDFQRFSVYDALFHTGTKLLDYFGSHERILISVSGGSDSDCIVHFVCTYFSEFLYKCCFVWVDTGLEYSATKNHLNYLEMKYGINIERIRGKSVVWVIKKFGVPILSKTRSEDIFYYQRGAQWAIDRIDGNVNQGTRYGYPDNFRDMIHFATDNDIKISPRCCNYSKKLPIKKYMRINKIDLNVTGERKAEGGQRACSHSSCFEIHKDGIHKFMPLWWWSDEVKKVFKFIEGIRYSDCYEIYGMKRTGCCGCPFNPNIADDLQAMFQFEPRLFNACMNVFGLAYELTDRFNCRRRKCIPEYFQYSF